MSGGTLVKQVLSNIAQVGSASFTKKVILYSAHDITLAAFLNALEVGPLPS